MPPKEHWFINHNSRHREAGPRDRQRIQHHLLKSDADTAEFETEPIEVVALVLQNLSSSSYATPAAVSPHALDLDVKLDLSIPIELHCPVQDPFGVLEQTRAFRDLNDLGQWFYHCQDPPGCDKAQWVASAKRNWVDPLWELCSIDASTFAFTVIATMHKRSALTAIPLGKPYYVLVGRMLSAVREAVSGEPLSTSLSTVVSISGLVTCAIRHDDYDSAQKHLQALRTLGDPVLMPDHLWLFIGWVDVMFATSRLIAPIHSLYIPPAVRQQRKDVLQQSSADLARCALRSCKRSQLNLVIPSEDAFQLFRGLHAVSKLRHDSSRTAITPSSQVLIWLVYELAHTLGTMLANLSLQISESLNDDLLLLAEIELLGHQLGVHASAHYRMPQRLETQEALLSRIDLAMAAMIEKDILVHSSRTALANMLWVCVLAVSDANGVACSLRASLIGHLKAIQRLLGVNTAAQFRKALDHDVAVSLRGVDFDAFWEALDLATTNSTWRLLPSNPAVEVSDNAQSFCYVGVVDFGARVRSSARLGPLEPP